MMTVLNRLRGVRGFVAKVNGLLLGIFVYLLFNNYYVAIAVCIGYILGESFGWGEWVGNLTGWKKNTTEQLEDEGRSNGIQWLATHIVKDYKYNFIKYCRVALTIRGIYWWLPTLAPLYFVGINPVNIAVAVVFLGIGFPLACEIGHRTSKLWSFKFMENGWVHQEVWYGFMQDIAIIYLIVTM